jgi:hypothetical protein
MESVKEVILCPAGNAKTAGTLLRLMLRQANALHARKNVNFLIILAILLIAKLKELITE